jgi:hypothetical protein
LTGEAKPRWLLDLAISCQRSSHAESIRDAVDVVKPASDQVDLQDGPVIESHPAQRIEIFRRDFPRVPCKFRRVIEHCPVGGIEVGLRVILPQRGGEFLIE